TGFNRLWQVAEDRPYWMNQLVGFTLTLACSALALFFVAISTGLHALVVYMPFEIIRTATRFAVIRSTITCLFIVTIFALYRFLPNKQIETRQVLPAAIIAGVMAEVVRAVFSRILPYLRLTAIQGPFSISVSFLLLVYFETFVVLGGAFLASRAERYPWMVFVARIIDGLTAGNLTVAQAYISDVTEPENRAKSFGMIGIAFGLGFLVGPALSGYLAQFSNTYPIYLAAGLSFTSIMCTYFLLPSVVPHPHPQGEQGKVSQWKAYDESFK